MNLEDLKKEITYKWRVQSFSKNKAKASCVAYIDSRDVQNMLDNVCGPENWQDKYYEADGKLFCSIGVRVPVIDIENKTNTDEWIWKSDCGVESNQDAEKGQASDAFKRAAVKWGIGRFLYDLKIVYVDTNGAKDESNKYPYVIDKNMKRVWDVNKHVQQIVTENNW